MTTTILDRLSGRTNGIVPGLAEEDKLLPTGGFKTAGHLYWSIARAGRDGENGNERAVMALKSWSDLLRKTPNGAFEESDPDGGILVPPQYSTDLYTRTLNQNQLLRYLNPIPIQGRILKVPALKEDSRVDGVRHGGILGYWQGEADQYTSTCPKLRMIDTMLHKLIVGIYATEELIEDSPQALEAYINPLAAAEINFKVNDAVLNGTGIGMPMGILKANNKIAVTAVSGQGSTLVGQNALDMNKRVTPSQRASSIWLYNQDVESALLQATVPIATNTYSATTIIRYRDDGQLLICGRPALLIEQCATLGTEGDLIAFAPDGYICVTKGGIDQMMSMHLRFDYDESMFKFRFRMDGQTKDNVALTPYKGSLTTSSVVTLSSSRT